MLGKGSFSLIVRLSHKYFLSFLFLCFPSFRFVLFDPVTKLWHEVSEEYAREKVSHSLSLYIGTVHWHSGTWETWERFGDRNFHWARNVIIDIN